MKVKSSVLFGLIVLTCLAGGISLIYRLTKEAEVWNPSEMYKTSIGTSKGTKCTTVSYAPGSTSDAPLVQLGAGSMSRPRVSYSYAPAGGMSVASSPNSPIALSPQGGLYTTSSAELRSFGGGGNGGGVSMSGGSVHSSGSAVSAPSMGLSATMPNGSLFTFAGQNTNANIPIVSGDAAIAAMASASSYTAAYSGIGYTTGGASRGISGRKNGAVENSWWSWLSSHNNPGNGVVDENGNWIYTYDKYDLQQLYNDFIAFWSKNFGSEDLPEYDEWLEWYISSTGADGYSYKNNTYLFQPIGDILPLVIMALFYLFFLLHQRKTKEQL